MRFNREDSRTVLPQLEKWIDSIENKFGKLADKVANLFNGNVTINGSLTVNSGLTVNGNHIIGTRKKDTSFEITTTTQTSTWTTAYTVTLGTGIWLVTAEGVFGAWTGLTNRGCGIMVSGGGMPYSPRTYVPETTNRQVSVCTTAIIPNGEAVITVQYQEPVSGTEASHTVQIYYHAVRIA